jgi:hypothetical protein
MGRRDPSIFSYFTILFVSSFVLLIVATPLVPNEHQKPFNIPKQTPQPPHHSATGGRLPSLDVALKSLDEASLQLIETFENVMSELGDNAKHMTWSLPQKAVKARPHDWDFTVSTTALPEHSLRVKKPDSLGVDDVKQVPSLSL